MRDAGANDGRLGAVGADATDDDSPDAEGLGALLLWCARRIEGGPVALFGAGDLVAAARRGLGALADDAADGFAENGAGRFAMLLFDGGEPKRLVGSLDRAADALAPGGVLFAVLRLEGDGAPGVALGDLVGWANGTGFDGPAEARGRWLATALRRGEASGVLPRRLLDGVGRAVDGGAGAIAPAPAPAPAYAGAAEANFERESALVAAAVRAMRTAPLGLRLMPRANRVARLLMRLARNEFADDPSARLSLTRAASSFYPGPWILKQHGLNLYQAGLEREAAEVLSRLHGGETTLGLSDSEFAGAPTDVLSPAEAEDLEREIAWISRRLALVTTARQATELLRRGRDLEQSSLRGAELRFAREAVALSPRPPTLRALFWAAHRYGDYATAYRAYRSLRGLLAADPDPTEARRLEKIAGAPTVRIARAIDTARPTRPITPADPRRVCYLLHNAITHASGGYATRAHGLSKALVRGGWDVRPVCRPGFPLDLRDDPESETLPEEIEVDGLAYALIPGPLRNRMNWCEYMLGAADRVEEALRVHRPAVVVAASNHLTALPGLIAARRVGVPFVYEVRGFWEITRVSREPEFVHTRHFAQQRYLESLAANTAAHVLTLTAPMRDELIARGARAEAVTLAPNACDVARFQPRPRDEALARALGLPDGAVVIGYVGSFVQYEGLDDLTEACARLHARGADIRLLLVGSDSASDGRAGPVSDAVHEIAARTGLGDRLIAPGRVPHEMVESYYSLIDVAPFPRKPQPVCEMVSPIKPLEAMAMEKAVVVSSVRALCEMVSPGETGEVFAKGDVTALADLLEALVRDPERRRRLGAAARRWVERERSWDRIAGDCGEVLAAAIVGAEPSAVPAEARRAAPQPAE